MSLPLAYFKRPMYSLCGEKRTLDSGKCFKSVTDPQLNKARSLQLGVKDGQEPQEKIYFEINGHV